MNIYLCIDVPAKSVPAAAVRQKMGIFIHMYMDGVYYHDRAESVVRQNVGIVVNMVIPFHNN